MYVTSFSGLNRSDVLTHVTALRSKQWQAGGRRCDLIRCCNREMREGHKRTKRVLKVKAVRNEGTKEIITRRI
jgi:hypothetical protein